MIKFRFKIVRRGTSDSDRSGIGRLGHRLQPASGQRNVGQLGRRHRDGQSLESALVRLGLGGELEQ